MSGNALPLLLAWMKDHPTHGDWDFIAALSPAVFNQSLQAGYVQRLAEQGAIEGIDARIAIPSTGITHHLFGYHLAAPEFELTVPSYETARFTQRTAVAGGVHVVRDSMQGVIGVSAHDALDGLCLRQTLDLIDGGQTLSADLALSDDLELSLGQSLPERTAGGEFFKFFFTSLPPELRVQTLLEFADTSGNAYLRSRRLGLRSHVSAVDGQLAVVLFAALEHGSFGAYPARGSNFPFLLTDEQGPDNPATVLLSRRLVHRAAFANAVEHLLEGGQFDYQQEADVRVSMQAKAGLLQGPGIHYDTRDFQFQSSSISVPVGAGALPLRVDLLASHAELNWQAPCSVEFRYKRPDATLWKTHTATFDFQLQHRFDLFKPEPEEAAGGLLLGQILWPVSDAPEVTHVSGLPELLPASELAQINQFIALALKQTILKRLTLRLTARVPEQVLGQVRLARHARLAARQLEMPNGLALFGSLQSGNDTLRITEPYVLLAAGDRHSFEIDPAHRGTVTWSVAVVPGSQGLPGNIDAATGAYRAPPAHGMGRDGVRVLVTATDTSTRARTISLVSALRQRITVNPLIRVCSVGDEVPVSAGTLGGELQWALVDPKPGSGALRPAAEGTGQVYAAAEQISDAPYLIEEVQASDLQTGAAASCHVLVMAAEPLLQVRYTLLPNGALQLQALIMGNPVSTDVQWQLPLDGPGEVTADGRYLPDPSTAAPYVLVIATYELPSPLGTAYGYLILPLDERWDVTAHAHANQP
ncbi:hypothetical protein [Pseudomonas sp. B21-047]|uniref:hypothetical protein n=1 Tax=Pseudomonas sp. B21-047 TaxID=2895489 RepID=UPI00215E385E|nr:hypothetical protein [Pseudomonas sp. B21-047]UVL05303.1 hypothetical protein LOY26_07090 [Pseudomonas sp. B21-047]